jgi:hypothetical protein
MKKRIAFLLSVKFGLQSFNSVLAIKLNSILPSQADVFLIWWKSYSKHKLIGTNYQPEIPVNAMYNDKIEKNNLVTEIKNSSKIKK